MLTIKYHITFMSLLGLSLLPISVLAKSNKESIEILHWWTAPGEKKSLNILTKALDKKSVAWTEFAILGEGGASAIRVLQMRALAGNPPETAQIKGPDIGEWQKLNMLKSVDSFMDTANWKDQISPIALSTITYDNHYMAVPVNVHRVNWLWLNKKIFDELKLVPPETWDEFFNVADKIKSAGYIALAHGDTDWQDALIFEAMAISMLGAEKYTRAFVELDLKVLHSKEMIAVFKRFKRLSNYTSHGEKKEWFQATQALIDNKAGMQITGDWAKGMLAERGAKANDDYICAEVPESHGIFSYNIDSFVFFRQSASKNRNDVQKKFVEVILSPQFQIDFSLAKGSLPVRMDIDMSHFDSCAKHAYQLLKEGELVPSFTQNLATTSYIQKVMSKIISQYFSDPNGSAQETVKRLTLAIRAVKLDR